MTRVQMQGKLHCEVIMFWNQIGTLANAFSHSRRPHGLFANSPVYLPILKNNTLRPSAHWRNSPGGPLFLGFLDARP